MSAVRSLDSAQHHVQRYIAAAPWHHQREGYQRILACEIVASDANCHVRDETGTWWSGHLGDDGVITCWGRRPA